MNTAPFLSVVKMLHEQNPNVTMTRAQLQFIRSAIRVAINELKIDGNEWGVIQTLEDVDAALKAVEQRQ